MSPVAFETVPAAPRVQKLIDDPDQNTAAHAPGTEPRRSAPSSVCGSRSGVLDTQVWASSRLHIAIAASSVSAAESRGLPSNQYDPRVPVRQAVPQGVQDTRQFQPIAEVFCLSSFSLKDGGLETTATVRTKSGSRTGSGGRWRHRTPSQPRRRPGCRQERGRRRG